MNSLFNNNFKVCLSFVTLVFISYTVSVVLFFLMPYIDYANIIGFLSLIYYSLTIIPTMIKTIFPNLYKQQSIWKSLLKNRRYTGVAAFCFACNHGALLIWTRSLNLLDFNTWITYFQGLSSIIIFTILAITSNDESVRKLKVTWKKIHNLTYLCLFILPWHILDKMSGNWTYLTPFAVILSISLCLLFVVRKIIEFKKK
ncbi:MAG: ferric reductase-like transmembrane domain-containing protein [Dolichospermum sp.]|jgi:sulfoxide reductase heme-binding subunit YedZ|nr:ferric reductase-like transmembrane domain-containing protein [Anabaena sp. 49628_E55]